MCSRIAGMSHIPDDKSAQEECCTPSNEHNPFLPCDRINLLAPNEEPKYPVDKAQASITRLYRIPPRRIALCGGGVRGVAHVGVFKALKDSGFLKYIKEVIGISAGSLFALLWVLDYSIEQIEKLSLELDFTKLVNIEPDTALLFPLTYGLDDGKGIENLIISILKHKGFSPDATFEDIHTNHKLHLRCFATELQTSKIREFSTLKTPKVAIKHALRASMSLPLFYTPVQEENGALLVDGGLLHNLPLVFLNQQEYKETWGVLFTIQQKNTIHPVTDVMEMLRYVYDSALIIKNSIYIEKYKDNIICIPADCFSALHFEETFEERLSLINLAYQKTKEFIFTKTKPSMNRRYSVS